MNNQPVNPIQSVRNSLAHACRWRGFLLTLSSAVFFLCAGAGAAQQETPQFGLAFSVNSGGDDDDALVGDNLCETATGECTLRAAIEETNFRATGEDGIFIEVTEVGLARALPDLTTPIEIVGLGRDHRLPAVARARGIACPIVGRLCQTPPKNLIRDICVIRGLPRRSRCEDGFLRLLHFPRNAARDFTKYISERPEQAFSETNKMHETPFNYIFPGGYHETFYPCFLSRP